MYYQKHKYFHSTQTAPDKKYLCGWFLYGVCDTCVIYYHPCFVQVSLEHNIADFMVSGKPAMAWHGSMFGHLQAQWTTLGPMPVYRKISNISRTKSQNLNDSHLFSQSSLPNLLRPGVKSRMKMQLEPRDRRCSNYIWVINNLIAY